MTFLHPQLLWLLALPALLLARALYRAIRPRGAAGESGAADGSKMLTAVAGAHSVRVAPPSGAPPGARRSGVFLALAAAFAITALARPQYGTVEEPVLENSREILVALDLSRSMLADDVKPSRLERARLLVQSLLQEIEGERVGLAVFAGTAFLQVPLSGDHEILREFLPSLAPEHLPLAGTNYAALLNTALESFSKNEADRFLVILSDGEADPENPWREPAAACAKRGIRVIALGVGTPSGAMIPDAATGGFVKDARGAVVLSRLEPATLRELASLTGGTYADASRWVDIAALLRDTVAKGRRGEFAETPGKRRIERYQWALAPALLFLLLSLWREFPARIKPRRLPLAPVFAAVFSALAWNAASAIAPPAAPDAAAREPAAEQSAALVSLVERLAAQTPPLSAADTVAFAEATLAFGNALRDAQKTVPDAVADDALEAVRRTATAAPAAADWEKLREQLEALKKKPTPPPQEKQDNKKEEQEQNNRDNKDSREQQQNQQSGQKDKQDGEQKEQQNGQNSQDNPQNGKDGQQNGKDGQQNGKDSQGAPSAKQDAEQAKAGDNAQSGDGKNKDEKAQPANLPPPRAAGEARAFKGMNEKDGKDTAAPRPDAQANTAGAAAPAGTRRVGGISVQDTASGKNADPRLLALLQRLENAKKGDKPGLLFQRMQDNDGNPQPAGGEGRSW